MKRGHSLPLYRLPIPRPISHCRRASRSGPSARSPRAPRRILPKNSPSGATDQLFYCRKFLASGLVAEPDELISFLDLIGSNMRDVGLDNNISKRMLILSQLANDRHCRTDHHPCGSFWRVGIKTPAREYIDRDHD